MSEHRDVGLHRHDPRGPESRARCGSRRTRSSTSPTTMRSARGSADGARAPAFIAQTIPLDEDHGGHPPPPARPSASAAASCPTGCRTRCPATDRDVRADAHVACRRAAAEDAAVDEQRVREFEPTATSVAEPDERAPQRPSGPPRRYTELDFDDVTGVPGTPSRRCRPAAPPAGAARARDPRGAVLAPLPVRQPDPAPLVARQLAARGQQGLNRMAQGRLGPALPLHRRRGAQQRVYCLTRRASSSRSSTARRRGPYVDPGRKWREPPSEDPRAVLRDLHVNAWVIALRQLAPQGGPQLARSAREPRRPAAAAPQARRGGRR